MGDEQPKLAGELNRMQQEPLLEVEKRLVACSLVLGVVLLLVLAWVSALLRGGA